MQFYYTEQNLSLIYLKIVKTKHFADTAVQLTVMQLDLSSPLISPYHPVCRHTYLYP